MKRYSDNFIKVCGIVAGLPLLVMGMKNVVPSYNYIGKRFKLVDKMFDAKTTEEKRRVAEEKREVEWAEEQRIERFRFAWGSNMKKLKDLVKKLNKKERIEFARLFSGVASRF